MPEMLTGEIIISEGVFNGPARRRIPTSWRDARLALDWFWWPINEFNFDIALKWEKMFS